MGAAGTAFPATSSAVTAGKIQKPGRRLAKMTTAMRGARIPQVATAWTTRIARETWFVAAGPAFPTNSTGAVTAGKIQKPGRRLAKMTTALRGASFPQVATAWTTRIARETWFALEAPTNSESVRECHQQTSVCAPRSRFGRDSHNCCHTMLSVKQSCAEAVLSTYHRSPRLLELVDPAEPRLSCV